MNVMHNQLMALAFLLCAITPSSYSQNSDVMDLAITNVSVIDVVSGGISSQSVLVNDGKIVRVLDPGESVGDPLEVIDGTDQFLLPGLWDMHVHIVYEAQLIQQMPDLFLDYGVTSVRDTGALLPTFSQNSLVGERLAKPLPISFLAVLCWMVDWWFTTAMVEPRSAGRMQPLRRRETRWLYW